MTPATFVILKSHLSEEASRLIVSEEDREALVKNWTAPDHLLMNMIHLSWMEGKTRWGQLNRDQIQTVIALHMTTKDGLSSRQVELVDKSLRTALVALIIALEGSSGWVTALTVNHLGPMHLEVEISMSLGVKFEPSTPAPPRRVFKVVVDNEKGS